MLITAILLSLITFHSQFYIAMGCRTWSLKLPRNDKHIADIFFKTLTKPDSLDHQKVTSAQKIYNASCCIHKKTYNYSARNWQTPIIINVSCLMCHIRTDLGRSSMHISNAMYCYYFDSTISAISPGCRRGNINVYTTISQYKVTPHKTSYYKSVVAF